MARRYERVYRSVVSLAGRRPRNALAVPATFADGVAAG
jgi:hypothetical protein